MTNSVQTLLPMDWCELGVTTQCVRYDPQLFHDFCLDSHILWLPMVGNFYPTMRWCAVERRQWTCFIGCIPLSLLCQVVWDHDDKLLFRLIIKNIAQDNLFLRQCFSINFHFFHIFMSRRCRCHHLRAIDYKYADGRFAMSLSPWMILSNQNNFSSNETRVNAGTKSWKLHLSESTRRHEFICGVYFKEKWRTA
jgi:hypothetical protein